MRKQTYTAADAKWMTRSEIVDALASGHVIEGYEMESPTFRRAEYCLDIEAMGSGYHQPERSAEVAAAIPFARLTKAARELRADRKAARAQARRNLNTAKTPKSVKSIRWGRRYCLQYGIEFTPGEDA